MMILQASNFVEKVDTAFLVIIGISVFFLIVLTFLMIFFVIRYSKKRNKVATQIPGSNVLEIIWSVIPLLLVLLMFYYGYVGYMSMRDVPDDAMIIKVTSRMWSWEFEYENGRKSDVLYVPLNKPVKLEMTSIDVIHSLYIPAFRVKEDIVPGKENYMWFQPTSIGEYDLFCTEYCGLQHSFMTTKVEVVDSLKFRSWVTDFTEQEKQKEDHPGLIVIRNNACIGCHSLDGNKIVGPSFKGLYGKVEIVETEGVDREITVGDEYLRTSIFDPDKDIVKGFSKGIMKSYTGVVTEEEANHIIEFLKTVSEE